MWVVKEFFVEMEQNYELAKNEIITMWLELQDDLMLFCTICPKHREKLWLLHSGEEIIDFPQ